MAPEAAEPPRAHVDQIVQVADGGITVRTYPGRRGELVLLHGRGTNLLSWTRVIGLLPRDLRVTAVDLRGHGRSLVLDRPATWSDHAADLAAVCAALGLRRPLLCGHSLGARIAELYAAGGGTCAGLVLLEGMFRVTRRRVAQSATLEEASAGPSVASCSLAQLVKLAAFGAKTFTPAELLEVCVQNGHVVDQTWYRRPDYGNQDLQGRGLLRDWPDDRDLYSAFYEQLRVPLIVAVWGELSASSRRASEADLEATLPLPPGVFSQVVVPGAGHFLPAEAPAAVAEAILRALAAAWPAATPTETARRTAGS